MKYYDYDMGNYDLHIIKTKKFRTVMFDLRIRYADKKEYARYGSLLSKLLVKTSNKYTTLKDVNISCTSIYDPTYDICLLESGSQDILGLFIRFCNEKYTEKGMNEESIKFVLQFLFEPKIIDGGFDSKVFEIEKNKLLNFYKSLKDYPEKYANSRFAELMQVRNYKEYSLEEICDLTAKTTNKDLYKFYQEIMKNGKLDIFVCGDVDENEIKDIVERNISFKNVKLPNPNHFILQESYNKKPNIIIEKSNNTQSKLIVGCKAINLTEFEQKYVFVLYSWILGGGVHSLLNQTVREKNSLCYYIYAVRSGLYGTMNILAGIDADKFDMVYELIQNDLKNMEKGNFSLDVFNGVKKVYYDSLIDIDDYPDSLMGNFRSMRFLGTDDIETRKEMMKKVTKEDVMALAKKIHIDTVYLLEGGKNEKENF